MPKPMRVEIDVKVYDTADQPLHMSMVVPANAETLGEALVKGLEHGAQVAHARLSPGSQP